MAFWGSAAVAQIMQIRDFYGLRGRARFTTGAWVYCGSTSETTFSFWRQDGIFSPVQQFNAADMRHPAWDSTGTLLLTSTVQGAAMYGNFAVIGLNQWTYHVAIYSARGLESCYYRPGAAPVLNNTLAAFGVIHPHGTTAMHIGGTESDSESVPTGSAIAELTVLDTAITPSQIPLLAHDPVQFRDRMILYCPLRDPSRNWTERVGGRSYRLVHRALSRAQILPGQHPPVQEFRTKSR
ncbi:MAG: hypothetical protein ACRC1H_09700 [Caldilineaceae bacterium]